MCLYILLGHGLKKSYLKWFCAKCTSVSTTRDNFIRLTGWCDQQTVNIFGISVVELPRNIQLKKALRPLCEVLTQHCLVFPHGKRGERGRSARYIFSLVFVYWK